MYEDFNLTARERGYRQPGKKLLVRDAFTAVEMRGRAHSLREFLRDVARECAAYGPPPMRADERKAEKLMGGLSAREVKRLRMGGPLPKRLQRAHDAEQNSWAIEQCIAADELMWRNAQ